MKVCLLRYDYGKLLSSMSYILGTSMPGGCSEDHSAAGSTFLKKKAFLILRYLLASFEEKSSGNNFHKYRY